MPSTNIVTAANLINNASNQENEIKNDTTLVPNKTEEKKGEEKPKGIKTLSSDSSLINPIVNQLQENTTLNVEGKNNKNNDKNKNEIEKSSNAITFKNHDVKNKTKISSIYKQFKDQPTHQICRDYMFIEILYNLFEKNLVNSRNSKNEFLQFFNEEAKSFIKYKKNFYEDKNILSDIQINIIDDKKSQIDENERYLDISHSEIMRIEYTEKDFFTIKDILENNNFDENNRAFEIYEKIEFLRFLCKNVFQRSEYLSIFKMRYFLNYLYKSLKSKSLSSENSVDVNNLYTSHEINKFKDDKIYDGTEIEDKNKENNDISFKTNKIIYSENKFYEKEEIEELIRNKEEFILSKDYIYCTNKINLTKLINYDINLDLIRNQEMIDKKFFPLKEKFDKLKKKDIPIVYSYLLSNCQPNLKNSMFFAKDSNNEKNNKLFDTIKTDINNSTNKSFNESMINSFELYSQKISLNTNKLNLNLNLFQNDFQNIFIIKNNSKLIFSDDFGNKLGQENTITNDKIFSYLIRNNTFLKITDIIYKTLRENTVVKITKDCKELQNTLLKQTKEFKSEEIEEATSNSLDIRKKIEMIQTNENDNDGLKYCEISIELLKFEDLPIHYKKAIIRLRRRLLHVPVLEYENDYLYLFEILQCLDMNDKVIDIIENHLIVNKDIYNFTDDEFHSLEDKKFLYAQNLFYLAEAYSKIENINKAIEYHEKSIKIKKMVLSQDHPEYVLSLNNLSSLYFKKNNYEAALKLYIECMEIEEKNLIDKKNPNLGITFSNLATVYNKLSQYEDALKFYFKTLEIEKYSFGEISEEVANTLNNIGIVYDNLGDYQNAFIFYSDAIKIKEAISDLDDIDLGLYYNNFAVSLESNGKLEESLKYYSNALEILKKNYDSSNEEIVAIQETIKNLREKLK